MGLEMYRRAIRAPWASGSAIRNWAMDIGANVDAWRHVTDMIKKTVSRDAVAVDISPIADLLEIYSKEQDSNLTCPPSFDRMWLETPVLGFSYEAIDVDSSDYMKHDTNERRLLQQLQDDGYIDIKWLYSVVIVAWKRVHNRLLLLPISPYFFVDSKGKIVLRDNGDIVIRHLKVPSVLPEKKQKMVEEAAVVGCILGARVLDFLNAKNVTTIDVAEPHTRKQRKARLPQIRYKQLVITKPGKKYAQSEGTGEGGHKAMHLVRGHLKTYEEKGLFGKYFGTFFIPSHVRGDEKLGEVRKTYKLEKGV